MPRFTYTAGPDSDGIPGFYLRDAYDDEVLGINDPLPTYAFTEDEATIRRTVLDANEEHYRRVAGIAKRQREPGWAELRAGSKRWAATAFGRRPPDVRAEMCKKIDGAAQIRRNLAAKRGPARLQFHIRHAQSLASARAARRFAPILP